MKVFCDACDGIGIHGKAEMRYISYFIDRPASQFLGTHLLLEKLRATGIHDERLLSYVKEVSYLLSMYAADGNIARAIKDSKFYKQD